MTDAAGPLIVRLLGFTAGWVILTEGSLSGWPVALLAICGAVVVSLRLDPGGLSSWSFGGVIRFVPFFVSQSLAGGFDVARRALDPRATLSPAMVEYPLRLPEGGARRFFAAATGLLPGTLTAQMTADHLRVHVLDQTLDVIATLKRLEDRTADLYGLAPLG